MSTPTDSVAPVAPTGTSSPWSMPLWWKRITDWLRDLSPAGATEYDTGWVAHTNLWASGYEGTVWTRRTGRLRIVRWECTTSMPAGSLANPLFTLPTGWRPPYRVPLDGNGAGARAVAGRVLVTGVVQLRNLHTAAVPEHDGQAVWVD